MSLFFLHPIYLSGLIAASVPLLIHLLNRRKVKRLRFPAVRFILLSQRRISRSHRLRHWILLALRTLAVCLLVLLLANPIFQTGAGLFAGGGPFSLVVVLDNSLSMKWSREGEGFKQVKEAVRWVISSLKDQDRMAVVPTNTAGGNQVRLKDGKESLLRDLDSIQTAAGTADFSLALSKAYELLREPAAQKEIWLITDVALTGWDRFSLSSLGQYDSLIPLKIIKVENKDDPPNATIKEVKIRGQAVGVGMPINVEASLVNFSDKEIKDLPVQLGIDGESWEQRLVSLPAKGELSVNFQLNLTQPGSHHGQVTIKKEGLAGNPTSYFTLRAQDRLKVLVVDGDPQTSLVQSETFFLSRALNPTGDRSSSLFLPTVVIPEGLNTLSLDSFQALILCNVATIPDAFVPRLKDYIRKGGGLLLFLGDRVQMDDYNVKLFQSSPSILPALLKERKVLSEAAEQRIAKVDASHPALQVFSDPILKDSLTATKVRGYIRSDAADRSALLTLASGDPLLSEKRVGPGRVLLFTTSADRDWNDLPLKTAYLPLVQSLGSYLTGGQRGIIDVGITVGDSKNFSVSPSFVGRSFRIIKPDGKERELLFAPNGDKASASFSENDLAGTYRLSLPNSVGTQGENQIYAVNSPFLESRLAPIGDKEIQAKLSPLRADVFPLETLQRGGTRTDLSIPLLVLLLITLASEGWLAQRFYE